MLEGEDLIDETKTQEELEEKELASLNQNYSKKEIQ
jgi:hypothetical protein